uniref:Sorting nexin n=1 Tax=Macrostomum lignano TaxID=282301 RepID=A0A1I8GLQ6_9PLAT
DELEQHHVDLSDSRQGRTESVDLGNGNDLRVEISDALSEKERVKFTIRTVTSLVPRFARPEFSVIRTHEEFAWLADRLAENVEYAGCVIPPVPPTPDFSSSREKLARLGEGESSMSKEEYDKMKSELEAEYLATFKKTVAMHEVFLRRIAEHPKLREDDIFKVFLEFDKDGFLKTGWKTVDDAILSTQKEKDEFFEAQKRFITVFYGHLRSALSEADRMNRHYKGARIFPSGLLASTADTYIRVSACASACTKFERDDGLAEFLSSFAEFCERYRKLEGRTASDSDLKLADTLHYYVSDCNSAKDLLYRRARALADFEPGLRAKRCRRLADTLHYYVSDCNSAKDLLYRRARALADFESANKELEKARAKGKAVQKAEADQEAAFNTFNTISEAARAELISSSAGWPMHKNLTELAESDQALIACY